MNEDEDALADRMSKVRAMTGLSARKLDELVNAVRVTSRIENGVNADPHVSTLENIARSLDISLDWLVMGKGKPPSRARILARVAELQAGSV